MGPVLSMRSCFFFIWPTIKAMEVLMDGWQIMENLYNNNNHSVSDWNLFWINNRTRTRTRTSTSSPSIPSHLLPPFRWTQYIITWPQWPPRHSAAARPPWPAWTTVMEAVSHLLLVCNSSVNILIYFLKVLRCTMLIVQILLLLYTLAIQLFLHCWWQDFNWYGRPSVFPSYATWADRDSTNRHLIGVGWNQFEWRFTIFSDRPNFTNAW